MGLIDQFTEMKDTLVRLALEPERLDAWVQHLSDCGMQCEVEWRPEDLIDTQRESKKSGVSGRAMSYGRLRVRNSAIDRICFVKGQSASRTSTSSGTSTATRQRIMYEDRFLIDTPGKLPVVDVRARRRPKRAFWILGRILAWQWKGGRFAQKLQNDHALNGVLVKANEGRITIQYHKRQRAYCIRRSYVGMTTEAMSGMLTGLHTDIAREYHFPTPDALQAYDRIAQYIRSEAALPERH